MFLVPVGNLPGRGQGGLVEWIEDEINQTAIGEMAGLVIVTRGNRDAAAKTVGADRREEAAARIGLGQEDAAIGHGQDDPSRLGERQLGPEFLFGHVAVAHAKSLAGEAADRHRIEVHAERLVAGIGQPAEQLRAEAAETEDDDLGRPGCRLVVGPGLAPPPKSSRASSGASQS